MSSALSTPEFAPRDERVADERLADERVADERVASGDATLADLRGEIERVDALIIGAIAERMALSRAAGRVKVASAQPVTDPAREAAVVARASVLARAAGLPEDEIRALYWRIMAISRRAQLDVQTEARHHT